LGRPLVRGAADNANPSQVGASQKGNEMSLLSQALVFERYGARLGVEPLTDGVVLLATQKARFEALNSPNGWGKWEHFLPFCADYLQACRDNPDALVSVRR
jgi:hypothetical protein